MEPSAATSAALYTTTYWSVVLPAGWTSRLEEGSHLFSSPDARATIRMGRGIIGRYGPFDDRALGAGMEGAALATPPSPVRMAGLDGLQAGTLDEQGYVKHAWMLSSGRFALAIEFQSESPQYGLAAASAILSTLVVNKGAVESVPQERDIAGSVGSALGTAYSYLRAYWWAIAFLILAALLVLAGGARR